MGTKQGTKPARKLPGRVRAKQPKARSRSRGTKRKARQVSLRGPREGTHAYKGYVVKALKALWVVRVEMTSPSEGVLETVPMPRPLADAHAEALRERFERMRKGHGKVRVSVRCLVPPGASS